MNIPKNILKAYKTILDNENELSQSDGDAYTRKEQEIFLMESNLIATALPFFNRITKSYSVKISLDEALKSGISRYRILNLIERICEGCKNGVLA